MSVSFGNVIRTLSSASVASLTSPDITKPSARANARSASLDSWRDTNAVSRLAIASQNVRLRDAVSRAGPCAESIATLGGVYTSIGLAGPHAVPAAIAKADHGSHR